MTRSLNKYIAITLILATAVSLTISGMWSYTLYQKAFKHNNDVIETYQTIRAINRMLLSFDEAALDVGSLIITGDTKYTKKLPELIISIQVNLKTLTQLIQDDATETEIAKKLNSLINKKIEFLQETMKLHLVDKSKSSSLIKNRLEFADTISELLIEIRNIEIGQLEQAIPEYQLSLIKANQSFILLIIFNVVLILLAYAFTRPLLDGNQ